MKNLRGIFLVGFSGSGKSTVGPLLGRALHMPFVDSDTQIEKLEGRSVPKVLNARGENYFRKVESTVIHDLIESKAGPKVIALGGGALSLKANRDLIFGAGLVVYLSCSVREIYRRLSSRPSETERPLLRVKPRAGETVRTARLRRIANLLAKRVNRYTEADIILSTTNKSPRAVVALLKRKKKKLEKHRDKD